MVKGEHKPPLLVLLNILLLLSKVINLSATYVALNIEWEIEESVSWELMEEGEVHFFSL